MQRFCFNSRTRQAGESVAAYLTELKKLSEHCAYGDSLNDMLRDRIVCGIQDQRTQCRLLAETDLTLKRARALEVAHAIESADKQVQELQHLRKAEVHAIGPQFRQCRDQVLFSALAGSTPETPTHRDASFARPPRTSPTTHPAPLCIAPLCSIVPLRSRECPAQDATECIGRPSAPFTTRHAMSVVSEAT